MFAKINPMAKANKGGKRIGAGRKRKGIKTVTISFRVYQQFANDIKLAVVKRLRELAPYDKEAKQDKKLKKELDKDPEITKILKEINDIPTPPEGLTGMALDLWERKQAFLKPKK